MAKLGRGLLLLKFESPKEVEQFLKKGRRIIKGKYLYIERWCYDIGYVESAKKVEEAWVRVVGLFVHLWRRKILRKIGDSCGSFLVVNEGMSFLSKLLWTRILVKLDEKALPNTIEMVVGSSRFCIQFWWEIPSQVGLFQEPKVFGKKDETSCRGEVVKDSHIVEKRY